jgi:hypothetical protein
MAKVIETNWRDEIVQPPKDTRVQTEVTLFYLHTVTSSMYPILIFLKIIFH